MRIIHGRELGGLEDEGEASNSVVQRASECPNGETSRLTAVGRGRGGDGVSNHRSIVSNYTVDYFICLTRVSASSLGTAVCIC